MLQRNIQQVRRGEGWGRGHWRSGPSSRARICTRGGKALLDGRESPPEGTGQCKGAEHVGGPGRRAGRLEVRWVQTAKGRIWGGAVGYLGFG